MAQSIIGQDKSELKNLRVARSGHARGVLDLNANVGFMLVAVWFHRSCSMVGLAGSLLQTIV